jgi:hypothetical protein
MGCEAEGAGEGDVLGVRKGNVSREAVEGEELLQQGMCLSPRGKEQTFNEGVCDNSEGVHCGIQAEPSERPQDRICDAASLSDGERIGQASGTMGSCASQERDQKRQPSRESGSYAETSTRQNSQAKTKANKMPPLRRHDKDFWACPSCGSNLDIPGAIQAGVVLDPFAGSGTTLAVATRLGRWAVGIDLNPCNLPLIRKRLSAESGYLFAADPGPANTHQTQQQQEALEF